MSRHALTPATAESVRVAVGSLTAMFMGDDGASHREYVEDVQEEMGADRANRFLRSGTTSVAVLLLMKLERFGFDPHEELSEIARRWGIPTDLDGGFL